LTDRGIQLHFQPSAAEVHAWVGGWYAKRGISDGVFNFIGDHVDCVDKLSGRHYITAQQILDAGLDFEPALYETWQLSGDIAVMLRLLRNPTLTAEQLEQQFRDETGKSRATFYRVARKLRGIRNTVTHAPRTSSGP
jgi:hypothetical protein